MTERERLTEAYKEMYGREFEPEGGIGDRPMSGGRASDALEFMANQFGKLNKNLERLIKILERGKG
jgi:hypothetical protein